MDYFWAFVILTVVIYRGLGLRDRVKSLEENNLAYEARIKALTAEITVLRQLQAYKRPPGPPPFSGYQAYWQQTPFQNGTPPPRHPPLSEWRAEFGFGYGQNVTRESINAAFRAKALKTHPDKGGNTDDMARLNRLKQQAFAEVLA